MMRNNYFKVTWIILKLHVDEWLLCKKRCGVKDGGGTFLFWFLFGCELADGCLYMKTKTLRWYPILPNVVFHLKTIIYDEFRNQSCYYLKSTTTKAAVFLGGRSGCATNELPWCNQPYEFKLWDIFWGLQTNKLPPKRGSSLFKPRAWSFKLSSAFCKISQNIVAIYWHRLSILCQWTRLKEICHPLRWFLEWQRHRLESKE